MQCKFKAKQSMSMFTKCTGSWEKDEHERAPVVEIHRLLG